MKIAIVGGCFTNQHNIEFSRLYHQTLKTFLKLNVENVEITTIRYERISKCLDKIIDLQHKNDFDLLIFHLRAEPIMRMSKLYYKYLNNEGKLRHSLNLPYLKIFYPEKFDLLSLRRFNHCENKNIKATKVYYLLREANYVLGTLLGNKSYALHSLRKLILDIQEFCNEKNINFLLLGPVSRPSSYFEDLLSERINKEFEELSKEESIKYLSLIRKKTNDNQPMFFENGIHVNQEGHDEIANMIYEKMLKEKLI